MCCLFFVLNRLQKTVLHSITDLKSAIHEKTQPQVGRMWRKVRVKVWGAEQNNCSMLELTTFVWRAELHHCYVVLRFGLLNTDTAGCSSVLTNADFLTCCYYSYYCSYNRLSIIEFSTFSCTCGHFWFQKSARPSSHSNMALPASVCGIVVHDLYGGFVNDVI